MARFEESKNFALIQIPSAAQTSSPKEVVLLAQLYVARCSEPSGPTRSYLQTAKYDDYQRRVKLRRVGFLKIMPPCLPTTAQDRSCRISLRRNVDFSWLVVLGWIVHDDSSYISETLAS